MRNTDPVRQTGDRPASEETGRHDLLAPVLNYTPGRARPGIPPNPPLAAARPRTAPPRRSCLRRAVRRCGHGGPWCVRVHRP